MFNKNKIGRKMIKENKFNFWIGVIGVLGLIIWITNGLFGRLSIMFTLGGSITFVLVLLIIYYQNSVGFKFIEKEY